MSFFSVHYILVESEHELCIMQDTKGGTTQVHVVHLSVEVTSSPTPKVMLPKTHSEFTPRTLRPRTTREVGVAGEVK